jgi:hypothetical protein
MGKRKARVPDPVAASSPLESESTPVVRHDRAIDKLNQRQRRYLQYLTDPESPTYDNQTASYRRAYGEDRLGAAVSASQALNSPNTALALKEELERQGLTQMVRINRLKDVILGHISTKSVQRTQRDPDTGETVTTTESSVRPQDVLRGLALASKLDGSDAARRAEEAARSTIMVGLAKRMLATLSPPTDSKARRTRKVRQGEPIEAARLDSADEAEPDAVVGQQQATEGNGHGTLEPVGAEEAGEGGDGGGVSIT